jgi:hypothetical protein
VATIAIVSIVFYARAFNQHFSEIPPLIWDVKTYGTVTISVVLVVFIILIGGTIWRFLLMDRNVSAGWAETLTIFSVSQFGKYLPGNVGQHIGRVVLAKEAGFPISTTIGTMVMEMFWGIGVGAGLGVLSFFLFDNTGSIELQWWDGPLTLTLLVFIVIIAPRIGIEFLNRYFPGLAKRVSGEDSIPLPKIHTTLVATFLFFLCFLMMGIVTRLQVLCLFGATEGSVLEFTCLFAIAWLGGYLVPGAPGGLGVREALMVLLFTPLLGAGTAVGLSVTLRATTITGDALAFLGALIFKMRLFRKICY